jgi:hypothetical protein
MADSAKIFANVAAYKRALRATGCDAKRGPSGYEVTLVRAALRTEARRGLALDALRYVADDRQEAASRIYRPVEDAALWTVDKEMRQRMRWGIGAPPRTAVDWETVGMGELAELWFEAKAEVPPPPKPAPKRRKKIIDAAL